MEKRLHTFSSFFHFHLSSYAAFNQVTPAHPYIPSKTRRPHPTTPFISQQSGPSLFSSAVLTSIHTRAHRHTRTHRMDGFLFTSSHAQTFDLCLHSPQSQLVTVYKYLTYILFFTLSLTILTPVLLRFTNLSEHY